MSQVGSAAPDFRLQNEKDEWVTLADLRSRGAVMLVFYPGDFTPTCTKQLCSYQDTYDRLTSYGLEVVGISGNTTESHRRFKAQYKLGFPLLSDTDRKVTKAYNVTTLFLLNGFGRALFVVDREGKIAYRYVEAIGFTHRKVDEVIQVLDDLKAKGRI